ncbi:uncharacterized protein N7458_010853 [Penicillium daleae]|uniref:Uncharacterized protein n=1 Tax=Penicillium daleae TaxID=63821 RepID=A0AAD6FZR0_9EURO|nr:uncharacterized protein N7458_010853 [Penicillium daleae]KAJ5439855.1 hypothetical protein N7458_010853 [Penicillium daleae]
MASPRKSDRAALARHHQPQSPFARAREPSYEFDLDNSHFPTPSKQTGSRPRPSFRTGTLSGAYRATSRASMSDDAAGLGLTTSPRQTRDFVTARSPSSDISNPPEELVDVYRRIEQDGTLPDYVPMDDWEAPSIRVPQASFGNENPPRRRTTDYARDEQRLRRVTGKDSPVFSKAKVGTRAALTADNLQRREEEEHVKVSEEEDGEPGPALNLPRTWGTRAGRRSEWLRNVSGSTTSETQERRGERAPLDDASNTRIKADENALSGYSARSSSRTVERGSLPVRSALGELTANLHAREVLQDMKDELHSWDQNASQGEGVHVPNTPIVVYKSSGLTKPSAAKRDSQDLLRKLARTESPKLEQMQTPDHPKLFERRIHDKTPRVTGAWIDTPMTERVTELPQDLTKDIVLPSVPAKEPEAPKQEQKPVNVQLPVKEIKPELVASEQPVSEAQPAKRSRASVIRPKLPKSGLQTVIEDVSSGKETLDLGDDTIESLQAIMDDQTELKTEEEEEAAYEQEVLRRLELANANGQDSVDIDRLNDKLHSLVRNISEVKKGLNSLEEHVIRDAAIVSRPSSPKKAGKQTLEWDSSENCEKCVHDDGRVYAAIPLPRLWKWNPNLRRRQLTNLGWVVFISLSWYIIECLMWDLYAHPLISETCEGYCLQADAPEFPFVTVTMLWRWSHLEYLLAPLVTISVACFRLVAQLLGLWDGYVEESPQLGNIVGEIRVNGTPVSFPWLTSPGQTVAPSQPSAPQPPVWTPRNEVPRNEAPIQWADDQVSMDEDEYL